MTQIFRITHINNLPFILQNGLHYYNAAIKDPTFTAIGFPTLVAYRNDRQVPLAPGGTLADYIPFYFWYKSPMLYVIHKGNDPEVISTPQQDIIYLISSFEVLQSCNCRFLFTDRHAKLDYAHFYEKPEDIKQLNWEYIKMDQWGRSYGAERKEMKQAECLVHHYMPCEAIIGIAVMNEKALEKVNNYLHEAELNIQVKIKPNFYF